MLTSGAVDIGGTATKIGIITEGGSVLARTAIPTSPDRGPTQLVDHIAATLRPMLEATAANGHAASGVGVSIAGFLDREHTAMFANANLPSLWGFPFGAALEERLALPCRLEVDTNASTVAEYRYGAGRGSARLLAVTIGTGMGGGVIVDGKLLRYTGECAGDLGHIIVEPRGRLCTCGARGCLEAMVCTAAIAERAAGRGFRDVLSGAQRGEPVSVEALAETGRWLGLGLASLSPLFAPDRIVVGGGVAAAGDLLVESARVAYRAHAAVQFRDQVQIVGSTFDGWEGMIGAGSLFLDPLG